MRPSRLEHAQHCARATLLLALGLLGPGCWSEDEERESERETHRWERVRRARARRSRNELRRQWHDQYRREIARATGTHTPPPLPPRSCEPQAELLQRTQALHHLASFSENVQLFLSPAAAGLVELDGRPHQSFRFALRMHPREEPALGRGPARDELELDLRWVPLCPTGPVVMHTQILRLGVIRNPPRNRLGLQLRLPGGALPSIAPGEPVELLLDPAVSSLRVGRALRRPRASILPDRGPRTTPPLGLWEITDARVPERPRLRRLELNTSAFGDRLRQISAVEVPCKEPSGLCRFLTHTRKHRELPLGLEDLLRRGAPLATEAEARQIWTVLLALRYPRCTAGEHRPTGRRHPCLDPAGPAGSEPCQFWLALNGFATRLVVQPQAKGFETSQVLSCPGARHRVLRVEATLSRGGDLRLRETDLTARAAEIEAELRGMIR